jgi:hypothetical protein
MLKISLELLINTSVNLAGTSDDGNTSYNFNFGNLNDEDLHLEMS